MKLFNLKLQYYLFLILAFVLPIHDRLVPPVIALIGLNWLLELNFREKMMRIRDSLKSRKVLAFGAIYLFYIIGMFYSTQLKGLEGAYFDLEVKLSLLVFPLLFATIDFKPFGTGFFRRILEFFVAGCFISGMLQLGYSMFDFLSGTKDSAVFFYTHLSHWHHPSYLALYFAFSIAILIHRLTHLQNRSSWERPITIFLILFFQLVIVLLSSKAGILSTFLMYLVILIYVLLKKDVNSPRQFLIPLMLTLTLVITMMPFPQSYGRFTGVKKPLDNPNAIPSETHESSAERVLIWKSAFEVIRAHPVFGVGTGDVKQALRNEYKANGITTAYEEHLNAHNQYLQTTIALGLLGFISLLFMLLLPAFHAFRNHAMLYLILLVLIAFNLLFESMLERQAGVVFYAFFNSLLFYYQFSEKN